MKIQKSPIQFPLLAAVVFTSLIAPLAADEFAFSDVKTKFSASMAMEYGGKKAPRLEKIEKAHTDGFDAIEFWAYQSEDIDAIVAK